MGMVKPWILKNGNIKILPSSPLTTFLVILITTPCLLSKIQSTELSTVQTVHFCQNKVMLLTPLHYFLCFSTVSLTKITIRWKTINTSSRGRNQFGDDTRTCHCHDNQWTNIHGKWRVCVCVWGAEMYKSASEVTLLVTCTSVFSMV